MKPLILLILALGLLPLAAHADPAANEARAQRLFTEVRCVECQSQDIGDSEAKIAADMRRQVRADVAAGKSDAQIRQSLYDHYGDYVLFRPRFSLGNLLLWGLPPLIIALGVGVLLFMRRKPSPARDYALNDDEQRKLGEIVKPE